MGTSKGRKMSHYRKIVVKDKEYEWCSCADGTFIRCKEDKYRTVVEDYDLAGHIKNPDGYWKDGEFRMAIKPNYIAKYIEENRM
jgi:hypothetical protein